MRKQKRPVIVNLAIVTVITVIVWIGFDVYRILTQKPTPQVPEALLEPLNPRLDMETLNGVQSRLHIDDSQIQDSYVQNQDTQHDNISTQVTDVNIGEFLDIDEEVATEEGELIE